MVYNSDEKVSDSTLRENRYILFDYGRNITGFPELYLKVEETATKVEEVKIENLINKEYPINSEMSIVMTFDVTKIPASALKNPFIIVYYIILM